MRNPRLYYRLSGKFSPLAPALMLVATGAAAVIGCLYSVISYFIPFVYLNFLLALGCGLAVGGAGYWTVRAGKVRNSLLAIVAGVVLGLIGLYASWSAWVLALSGWEVLILSPTTMIEVLKIMAADGVWSAFGGTPTGWVLYVIWTVEALMIVGGSTLLSLGGCLASPFCEKCDQWITQILPAPQFENNIHKEDCIAQLEAGNFDYLNSFKSTPSGELEGHVKVELLQCPTCQSNHFLNVKIVDISFDQKNQKQTKNTEVVQHLVLDTASFEKVRQILDAHARAASTALPSAIPPEARAA